MKPPKGLVLLAAPVLAGSALLIGVLLSKGGADEAPRPVAARKIRPVASMPQDPPQETAEVLVRPAPVSPSSEAFLLEADEEARVRGTYQNYRSALATGNTAAQGALEHQLRLHRALAVQMIESDLSAAQNDFDRSLASQMLEALRR